MIQKPPWNLPLGSKSAKQRSSAAGLLTCNSRKTEFNFIGRKFKVIKSEQVSLSKRMKLPRKWKTGPKLDVMGNVLCHHLF